MIQLSERDREERERVREREKGGERVRERELIMNLILSNEIYWEMYM